MASGRLCQNFISSQSAPTPPVTILDSSPESLDDGLNDSLIPTWDDAEDLIRKIFEEEDAHESSSRGDDDEEDWDDDDDDDDVVGRSDGENEENQDLNSDGKLALPPWLSKHRPTMPYARQALPVISSEDSDEEEDGDGGDDETSSEDDTRQCNDAKREKSHSRKPRRGHQYNNDVSSQYRFSLPKHLLHNKSTTLTAEAVAAMKFPQNDLSKAVRSPAHGEVVIRVNFLQRHQLPEALDVIRGFGYPTRRLVLEDVHQGDAVEALLIYLLEATQEGSSHPLRSLRYTGSWMSPTLISYIAACQDDGIEELELGLSLYSPTRASIRRTAKRPQNRNMARHLQRLEELEEAVAANQSLRVLHFLPSCHAKVTEGLVWATSCHPHLERIVLTVPVRTPQNTKDVHESGILLFEGLGEVIRRSSTLAELSLRVDPSLCRLRRNSHEPPEAKQWQSLAEGLSVAGSLLHFRLEFQDGVEDAPGEVLDDMNTSLMQGISRNSSLQSLELVNAPPASALNLWYGVNTRQAPLQQVSLYKSPSIVSYMSVLEDEEAEEQPNGWFAVSSLSLDQASLAEDLFGLELISRAGGLEQLVLTDSIMSEKKTNRLLEALGNDSKVHSLKMGYDSPCLLSILQSASLQSLEVVGGRYSVSVDSFLAFLEGCPSLRSVKFVDVKSEGDWTTAWKAMEDHPLETLEFIEKE